MADYEGLEREDILAALSYAARLAHVKRLDPGCMKCRCRSIIDYNAHIENS